MTPALLAALINQVAIPEITAWLSGLNKQVTDADVIAKLATDTQTGEQVFEAWLAAHPQ